MGIAETDAGELVGWRSLSPPDALAKASRAAVRPTLR